MSPQNATLTVSNADSRNDELFTAPSSDPTPDRHPSILRPGGHASPLKYPAVLRPGNAVRRSRTPSPNNGVSTSAAQTPQQPAVAYKAYSPPGPQSPSDELSAEIEEYFTALEVPPLNISKPASPEPATTTKPPLPAKTPGAEAGFLEERCVSPPIPPKERISVNIERHVVSPMSELDASTRVSEDDHHNVSPTSETERHGSTTEDVPEPPPAYDETQRVPPPPEKSSPARRLSAEGLAGAAVASAAQVGSSVAGVSSEEAAVAGGAGASDGVPDAQPTSETASSAPPPPLPPRPTQSATGKGKEPSMPGAFPGQPTRPEATTSYKASGAAATSAASVGASVAGVGQSAGLRQARKALEKGIGHMIDKAKEHHRAREQQAHHERKPSRKSSPDAGKKQKKGSTSSAPVAEVSCGPSTLSTRPGAKCLFA